MDDLYSDQDMEAATGLPLIHVRRLITWGAVTPARGGKGVVRQWDRHAVRHIACVNALYSAGLSLPMAHTLGTLMLSRIFIDAIDPEADIAASAKRRWFSPEQPLRTLEKSDTMVIIVGGYSVFWQLGERKAHMVGRLSADRSVFGSVINYSEFIECNPASLSWEHRPDLAEESVQAEAAVALKHPVSINSINLSLAARIAMRRLLKIPVFFA